MINEKLVLLIYSTNNKCGNDRFYGNDVDSEPPRIAITFVHVTFIPHLLPVSFDFV